MVAQMTLAESIAHATMNDGGATFNRDGESLVGSPGYSVAVYPDREQIVDGVATAAQIDRYIARNWDAFMMDDEACIGTWVHEGKTYLDVVRVIPDYDRAMMTAITHNQLAIFDLHGCQEIPCVREAKDAAA